MKTNKILSAAIILPVVIFLAYLILNKNLSSGDTAALVVGIVLLVVLLIAIINIESIKELGFSFKQGLILKTTIEEAKNLIEQMKTLAVLISAPVANTVSYGGHLGFHFTNEDVFNFREDAIKLFDAMQLSSRERTKTMDILDNRITTTLLMASLQGLAPSPNSPLYNEKQKKWNQLSKIALSHNSNKVKEFEDKLAELNELTPSRQKILDEAKYFNQHKKFKDYMLVKEIFK